MSDHLPYTFKINQECIDSVVKATRILILCHNNPDGDALGSSTALAHALISLGKKAKLHLNGDISEQLLFLLKDVEVDSDPDLATYDLVFLLDCHGADRMGPIGEKFEELHSLPFITFDHHKLKDNESERGFSYIFPDSSSTGELIWQFLKKINIKASKNIVQGILLAIVADTAFFSQSNTSSKTLEIAAELFSSGADIEEIKQRLYQNQPLRKLKLMGLALDNLSLHCDGRLASMKVTKDMLSQTGAEMADTEDFIELLRSLSGVKIAVFIKDLGTDGVKVGLRSKSGVNVRALANSFGGGGHIQAAGYTDTSASTADEALNNLLAVAENYL